MIMSKSINRNNSIKDVEPGTVGKLIEAVVELIGQLRK